MSKLPTPSAPVRDFEYVSNNDSAAMRVRLQQHFGAAGVHVHGHVEQAIRTLCERSLLPPLTVLDELLAKISRNARLPDIIARVRSLTAPSSATKPTFHQAVRFHLLATLPLPPASPSRETAPSEDCAEKHVSDAAAQRSALQAEELHAPISFSRDLKRARGTEDLTTPSRSFQTSSSISSGGIVSTAKRGGPSHMRPVILLPPNVGSAVLNIANAKQFFQDGILSPHNNDAPISLSASACSPLSSSEIVVNFKGNAYVLKEMSSCTLHEWLMCVVAIVVQANTWQFKDFHAKDPVQIFSTVKGFYVQYTESLCDACVSAWNVQVVRVSRRSHHLDSPAQRQMWESIADQAARRRLI